MAYVEEREFTLRFELRCEFPEGYEGEADGYEWAGEFGQIASELLAATRAVIARHPGWSMRTRNRGRSSEDEVTIVLDRRPE
jgi:hypothetical protein